jgi:hypothetical protein
MYPWGGAPSVSQRADDGDDGEQHPGPSAASSRAFRNTALVDLIAS